ncbi:choice-of-anchor D domain-containing protein, partial [Candidatus Saccharibacteria bacterium]|nr:choice-of-anchor D domain-containing protein [Candidatus Saccharibacteria bacterium]
TGTNAQRDVQGTATTPALIDISETDPYDFGSQALGSTTQHSFTLTNNGGVTASSMAGVGLAAPFQYKDGSYPGTGGSCGLTLANGANCTIFVTYTPSTAAVHNDTIQINYNNGSGATQSNRDVTGTGTSSAFLSISDGPTYDFQDQAVGSTVEYTFTLQNTGSVTATTISGGGLAAPYTYKGGSFPGTGGNCGATLAPAGSCDFIVEFSPGSSGVHNDTIDISYYDGAGTSNALRPVTGTGVDPAQLVISNAPLYDFSDRAVGSTNEVTLTIDNTGGFGATAMAGSGLAAPYTFKGGSYPGSGGSCGATLSAGGSCTIVVRYAPVATGSTSDTVLIDYNDGVASQQTSRDVQGNGVVAAFLLISDATTYNYGNQARGSDTDHTFTVDNTGGAEATAMVGTALTAPFSYKGGSYPGTGGDCSGTLAIGAQCSIVVTFSPTANGLATDTIDINYHNGAGAALAQRNIEGTGVDPALVVIDQGPTYDFGVVTVNDTIDHTFNVENQGGFQATLMAGSGLAAPYSFKGGAYPGTGGTCGTDLAVSGSCTIIITLYPTATGTYNDTILIDYDDGAVTQQATRDLTAIANTPA